MARRNLSAKSGEGDLPGRLWQQGGGYGRNMRSDRDIHEKIRYIHENPVRRGLAESPEDWFWSSCRAHYFGEIKPLAVDTHSIPELLT